MRVLALLASAHPLSVNQHNDRHNESNARRKKKQKPETEWARPAFHAGIAFSHLVLASVCHGYSEGTRATIICSHWPSISTRRDHPCRIRDSTMRLNHSLEVRARHAGRVRRGWRGPAFRRGFRPMPERWPKPPGASPRCRWRTGPERLSDMARRLSDRRRVGGAGERAKLAELFEERLSQPLGMAGSHWTHPFHPRRPASVIEAGR